LKPNFTDKWKKQRNFYKNAVIDDKGNTWPYIPQDVRELGYEDWVKDITDPSNGECYKGSKNKYMPDGKGGETVQVQTMEPREEVIAITRLRREDGEEFLLTKRYFIGYTQFGTESRFYMPYKEFYEEPDFKWYNGLDHKTGKIRRMTNGPQGHNKHYLLSFSPEAVDELMKEKWNKRVSLVVKDDMTGEGKACPDLEMFKTRSFDYIKNMEYLSAEQKEAELKKLDAEHDQNPTTSKKRA
jgi:hypothetical protein